MNAISPQIGTNYRNFRSLSALATGWGFSDVISINSPLRLFLPRMAKSGRSEGAKPPEVALAS